MPSDALKKLPAEELYKKTSSIDVFKVLSSVGVKVIKLVKLTKLNPGFKVISFVDWAKRILGMNNIDIKIEKIVLLYMIEPPLIVIKI